MRSVAKTIDGVGRSRQASGDSIQSRSVSSIGTELHISDSGQKKKIPE